MSAARRDGLTHQCDVDYGYHILATCSIITILACITLVVRIYARGWVTRSTDRDDYTMWVAVALSVAGFAVIIPEVDSGAGRYGACLSPKDLQLSLMLQFITQLIYTGSILLVKVSIVFCLLRFAPSKVFSRFLWAIMIFFIGTASMYFIIEVTQCQPLSTLWDISAKGRCIPPSTIQAAAYANNAISLSVDLLLATLPMLMIWNLHVEMHVKVAIGFVMSLGALAAAACAIRIHYLTPYTTTGDALFDSVPCTIWTAVECNIAIIAASVPSIVPILKKFNARGRAIWSKPPDSSRSTLQVIEQGTLNRSGTKYIGLGEGSAQRIPLGGTERAVKTKDMIPKIFVDQEDFSPVESVDSEEISQMYAKASRSILIRNTLVASKQEDFGI